MRRDSEARWDKAQSDETRWDKAQWDGARWDEAWVFVDRVMDLGKRLDSDVVGNQDLIARER